MEIGIEYRCDVESSAVGPNFQYVVPAGTGAGSDNSKLTVDPGAHPPITNATKPCGKKSPGGGGTEGEPAIPLTPTYSPRTNPQVGPPPLTFKVATPEVVDVGPVNCVVGGGGVAMTLAVTTLLVLVLN